MLTSENSNKTCTVCGYVYNPAAGDPESGIPPGTDWVDIHDDWLCPDCQMPKSDFE